MNKLSKIMNDLSDAISFGTLLSYQIGHKTSITYTNLLGKESLDNISRLLNFCADFIFISKGTNI